MNAATGGRHLIGVVVAAILTAATLQGSAAAQPAVKATPPPEAKKTAAPSEPAPSAAALNACLGRGEQDGCLDQHFREFLRTHSTADALALVRRYQETDWRLRLGCHPVVHAIGRETFRLKRTIHDAFSACDQTCHSGCYHGVVERFLRGDATAAGGGHISQEDLQRRARDACDPRTSTRIRFQCLHGLGHAVMYFAGYQLERALGICEHLEDHWSQRSCYGGVFMENLFSATPERRDVSPTDYHYPCSKLGPKYGADCYLMQTWRMGEMGLSTEELFAECKNAGPNRSDCVQSVGRDLSNDVRVWGPEPVARRCGRRAAADRRACIRGVVYALIDNTWDGRYALPLCSAFPLAEDVMYCFRVSARYLGVVFEQPRDGIARDCQRYGARTRPCAQAVRAAPGRLR